jgi:predicted transcriptional regulator
MKKLINIRNKNNRMELQDLKKIGLTHGEIKIYEALLDLGECTRTILAKKSGISPSKIYDVANRLIEKGIISSVKKNNVIHFNASDPEKLKEFISKKEKELEKEKELVDSMLPTLMAKYADNKEKNDVEVFYGWEGMKTVYNDITNSLKKGEFNYIFGASLGYNSKQADLFFNNYYHKKNIKGFGTKIIFNEEVRKNKFRIESLLKKPNEVKYLYNETFTEINLYKNTVLIVLLLKQPMIIRIQNQEAADSFKKFFDSMWKIAKE